MGNIAILIVSILIYPRQEYPLKWINKTAAFVKCFLVEYLLTATSSMPDISTSVKKQKLI